MSPYVLKVQSKPEIFVCLQCGRRFPTEREAESGHLAFAHPRKADRQKTA